MASNKKAKGSQGPSNGNKSSCLKTWGTRLVVFLIFVVTCGWLDTIKSRWYVFDPTSLHELAQAAIAASPDDTAGMISHIVTNLTATYPSTQIRLNPDSSEWVFNNAGGAMGAMYIIHASITEYLIIFGTPLGTEGHTGLHTADDYFHILVGEQWAFKPGALEMERYPAGSQHFLPRFTAKQYKMHEGCFALEYARGWIPLMLPFGFADTITSTLDIPTFYHTARVTGREMIKNLLVGKI
ncbi:C-8 sterol isomerase [Tephrocybe sp. NHM501043]|nr:C-8 sterol isomerase [Tephrocybe sp. NHM501043]